MARAHVVGDGFAVGDDDLMLFLVDPDAALEIALFLFDDFGPDVEDPGIDLVDFLLADVGDVVLRGVLSGEDEGQPFFDVGEVSRDIMTRVRELAGASRTRSVRRPSSSKAMSTTW